MKAFLAAAVIGVWTGAALAADPVEGMWKTRPDDNGNFGYVLIKPCAAAFCGALIQTFDGAGAPGPTTIIGKQIVWDMIAAGDGTYGDGQIWAPDRDKTYSATMQLTGDALSVSGCVLGGLICRAQDWTRVK